MALLTRKQIDTTDDRRWEDVDVPEWGGEVRIRALTGSERDAWEASAVVSGPNGSVQRRIPVNARSRLLVMCLVDENFERLYGDKDGIAALAARDGKTLDMLFDVARRLSGLGKDSAEEKKGNSEAAQSGSSTSD